MRAVNECPRCGELAHPAEPGGLCAFYASLCVTCWRAANPGKPLPLPSQEFFPPSRIAESKLFKKQYDDIWQSMSTDALAHAWDEFLPPKPSE